MVKPRRSPRVQQQGIATATRDEETLDSTDSYSTNTDNSKKQVKLTDMISKMKAPSMAKTVDLVPLRTTHATAKNANNISKPSKSMTKEMIALLDEVEKKKKQEMANKKLNDTSNRGGSDCRETKKIRTERYKWLWGT